MDIFATSIKETQQNSNGAFTLCFIILSVVFIYCYAECHYAECRGAYFKHSGRNFNNEAIQFCLKTKENFTLGWNLRNFLR
jgi:hypothetical protein